MKRGKTNRQSAAANFTIAEYVRMKKIVVRDIYEVVIYCIVNSGFTESCCSKNIIIWKQSKLGKFHTATSDGSVCLSSKLSFSLSNSLVW